MIGDGNDVALYWDAVGRDKITALSGWWMFYGGNGVVEEGTTEEQPNRSRYTSYVYGPA